MPEGYEPVINPDDPYGSCVTAIKDLLVIALRQDGKMSEKEFENLKAIEEFIRRRDNS